MAEKPHAVLVRPLSRREFMRRMGIVGAALPAGALLAGCLAADPEVADEVEDRTITYLFTRPISRGAIIAGRPTDYADDNAAMGVDALAFLNRTREKLA